jgi:hypothetical protein
MLKKISPIISDQEAAPTLTVSPKQDMRRAVLAIGLNVAAILTPSMAALFIVQRADWEGGGPFIVPYTLYTLVFPLLWLLRKKIPFDTLALVFLAALMGLGFLLQLRGGLNFSIASIQL